MTKTPTIPTPIFGADALLDRLRPALAAGLNLRQAALLLRVAAHPGNLSTLALISKLTNIPNQASITRACDGLVAAKLMARWADPQDRRRVVLALTPAGVKLAGRMVGTV